MKLTLAENIRAFRKERRLTQEQFAEAMGVTVGSVYKWETGQTIPELGMLVKIADFFDTSMDALLGYRVKDNRTAAIAEKLREYCRVRNPEALAEAEKALKKYPNTFEVVHGCAQVYAFFGIGSKDHTEARRALELYEQAKLLIMQNHDPKISEQTISGEMAAAWMILGEREKSIELLKKNNAGGVYSNTIGIMLALDLKKREEAEPFLAESLPLNTTIQRSVERNQLSRVNSIMSVGSQGMIPIASVLAGAVLQAFGSTVLLVICAAGVTITAVLLLTNKNVQSL